MFHEISPLHDLKLGLHESLHASDVPLLTFVLDNISVPVDDVDGRERLGVEVGLHELPLLVSAELVDGNVELLSESGVLR